LLEELAGQPVPVNYGSWRPGDQRVFVADIRRAEQMLGWRPKISPREGITRLYQWVAGNPELFQIYRHGRFEGIADE
jgi:CDP-paratose 2-epimerase